MTIKVICLVILATAVAHANGECSSDSLRQFAIDACHVTKRSAHFKSSHFRNEGYGVEHVTPKYHNRHSRPAHTKKLTRDDFPSGAYLLLHPSADVRHGSFANDIDQEEEEEDSYDDDYLANEILTMDMDLSRNRHHKHKYAYRFRRSTAAEILIEHCCSQASADVCGKYFCH